MIENEEREKRGMNNDFEVSFIKSHFCFSFNCCYASLSLSWFCLDSLLILFKHEIGLLFLSYIHSVLQSKTEDFKWRNENDSLIMMKKSLL